MLLRRGPCHFGELFYQALSLLRQMLQTLLVVIFVHSGALATLLLIWLLDSLALFETALIACELRVFLLLKLVARCGLDQLLFAVVVVQAMMGGFNQAGLARISLHYFSCTA